MKTWHYIVIGIVVLIILYFLLRKPKVISKTTIKKQNWWEIKPLPGNNTLTNEQLINAGYSQDEINQSANLQGQIIGSIIGFRLNRIDCLKNPNNFWNGTDCLINHFSNK